MQCISVPECWQAPKPPRLSFKVRNTKISQYALTCVIHSQIVRCKGCKGRQKVMRILKIQTGSRLEWYPRIVKSMTRIHVVLWRSYAHILTPKQLKDKTFFTADVEEALLYAPTLALNLQWSPRTNRGCSTELTAVMCASPIEAIIKVWKLRRSSMQTDIRISSSVLC